MAHVCSARFAPRLWIYTNFDCNLACSYCCARSGPRVERRSLSISDHRRLIEEAVEWGIEEVYLTGGEPFLLPDIADRIRISADRIPTTVLTNAMLFRGSRLESLESLVGVPVRFQVSLDGPHASPHDAVRGKGSWQRAVAGIRQLVCLGFAVSVSSTDTAANRGLEEQTAKLVASLGIIPEEDVILKIGGEDVIDPYGFEGQLIKFEGRTVDIELLRGATSRHKMVNVSGSKVDPESLLNEVDREK